jgi:hypothetical protein
MRERFWPASVATWASIEETAAAPGLAVDHHDPVETAVVVVATGEEGDDAAAHQTTDQTCCEELHPGQRHQAANGTPSVPPRSCDGFGRGRRRRWRRARHWLVLFVGHIVFS